MTSAKIIVLGKNGSTIKSRALLDTCSTANFMTESLATQLQLHKETCSIPVGALNELNTYTKHVVTATIQSTDGKYKRQLNFLTIPTISDFIPNQCINREAITIPRNLRLADPEFYKPAAVDILLGTGPTLSVMSIGQINLSPSHGPDLYLQKTQLGWVIGGSILCTKPRSYTQSCHITPVNSSLTKFWELEEGTRHTHQSKEELATEEHFENHVKRDKTGRYIVALPFTEKIHDIGNSRERALKRFHALERRFNQDPEFKEQYSAVIDEYLTLGHMSKVTHMKESGFYLPYHAVTKVGSLTTKIRVVFDGSAKSTSGISLNESLMVGPTIQDDIFTLILRFRCHRYVLTGDIEKMYRQFLVQQSDRKYQQIIWRDKNSQLATYELNTVTFGLSAAPFLAIRCLHQLANDESIKYPTASRILKNDFYVDDLLTGFNTINEAMQARQELTTLLNSAGLHIRQWASNEPILLQNIPTSSINQRLHLSDDKTLKTLGISWRAQSDSILYTVNLPTLRTPVTKRSMLSDIAKIFDPLGLLGPIILTAKRLIQLLWESKVDWDESVPSTIHTSWLDYCTQLNVLTNLSFPRHAIIQNAINIQLHGFCDASTIGYGACLYLRSINKHGKILTRLLCSKSRVAPLKTVSIPRLELCGAHLLSQLCKTVIESFTIEIHQVTLWSDSMVTLHWIKSSPHTLKTFVANRVADIQNNTPSYEWRHIRSEDNPADALSRGQSPKDFMTNIQWQHGPSWLKTAEKTWSHHAIESPLEDIERKKIICFYSTPIDITIITRFSSITKLVRTIAYCLRFKKSNHYKGELHNDELNSSNSVIIRMIQQLSFPEELFTLKNGKELKFNSKLRMLTPFLDDQNIMRVGGRLQNAKIPFTQQHPIILPKNNYVTELIIKHEHIVLHHAGSQTTLYSLRQRYWLMDGRNQVRKFIRQCVRCIRVKPSIPKYIMGNLPQCRVNITRPFTNVGIDYCGPFFVKEKKLRNRGRVKSYVAVFICLAVKAVHLELVTDLTTSGFISALRRFISRRGKPHTIHSDNGTNFVGANNEMKEIVSQLQSTTANHLISTHLQERGIVWKFLPPQSPHFGGIWEAAVKSFKHHLKRVVGNELFTFEQLNTLVTEIEAVLNSRPLTPISSDPNDLLVLTPGHFLIGCALTSLPEQDFSMVPINHLSTWQHIQKLKRDFWTRWYKEYLNELNIRRKWHSGGHQISKGSIVLLKDDNLPPMQWRMGRVIDTHPGDDGVVRVVSIRTSSGTTDRNIKKLALLPTLDNTSLNVSESLNNI